MPLFHRVLFLLSASALLLGCGSSGPTRSYDASEDQIAYESNEISVGRASGSGYGGSSTTIVMRVTSACSGINCTPESADLQFALEGTAEGGFTGRTLSISANGKTYTFGNRTQRARDGEIDEMSSNRTLKIAGVSLADLEEIATAPSVDGRLGGLDLDLENAQSELQAFISMVRNPEDAGADS